MKSLCYQLLLLPKWVIFRTSLSELPIWVVDFSLKLTFFASKKKMIIRIYPYKPPLALSHRADAQMWVCS